jgi:hypothetical protein
LNATERALHAIGVAHVAPNVVRPFDGAMDADLITVVDAVSCFAAL